MILIDYTSVLPLNFKEAVCCPSVVIQGAAQQKNEGECPGYLGPSGRPTAILTQPKWGWGQHHHVEAAVDWCRLNVFVCTECQIVKLSSIANLKSITGSFMQF